MDKTLNKTETIAAVAAQADVTKKAAEAVVNAFLQVVTTAMAEGDKVQIPGFGTFETRARAERQGKNPATGEAITVPACKVVAFKAGKSLKDAANNK